MHTPIYNLHTTHICMMHSYDFIVAVFSHEKNAGGGECYPLRSLYYTLGTVVRVLHLTLLILTTALQGRRGHFWSTDVENEVQSG